MTPTLISEYYSKAYGTTREAEDAANVTTGDRLTVQVMVDPSLIIQCDPSLTLSQDKSWGAGGPLTSLANTTYAAYDDPRYLKNGGKPMIIGEWSLSPP